MVPGILKNPKAPKQIIFCIYDIYTSTPPHPNSVTFRWKVEHIKILQTIQYTVLDEEGEYTK